MASADLKWLLVRNNSSFLIKRDGIELTSEPGNVTNLNTYKFSGLANNNTVDVKLVNNKPALVVSKKGKASTSVLARGYKNGTNKSAAAIRTATQKSYVRGDLTQFAIARYHALNASLKPVAAKKIQKKARGAAARK